MSIEWFQPSVIRVLLRFLFETQVNQFTAHRNLRTFRRNRLWFIGANDQSVDQIVKINAMPCLFQLLMLQWSIDFNRNRCNDQEKSIWHLIQLHHDDNDWKRIDFDLHTRYGRFGVTPLNDSLDSIPLKLMNDVSVKNWPIIVILKTQLG